MDCPRWEQFLKESVQDDTNIALLQTFFGSCLTGAPLPRAALLLAGQGLGKDTVVRVLTALVGTELRTDFSPKEMSLEWVRGMMVGSRLNVCHNPSFKNASILKSMIAGDVVTARKKHGPVFTWTPRVKFVFVSNTIPVSVAESSGCHRRILVVSFTSRPAKIDPLLFDRLGEELEAIHEWALATPTGEESN